MRASRFAIVFASLAILAFSTVSAMEGAGVIRGEGDFYGWSVDGQDVFLFVSSNSGFFCEDGDFIPMDWQQVWRPNEVLMLLYHGQFFARVYQPLTADEFWADPFYYLCSDMHIAEGVVQYSHTDSDFDVTGDGTSTWGWRTHGLLYDLNPVSTCESGIVKLNEVKRFSLPPGVDYPDCWPGCVETRVFKGPELKCAD